ncbi:sugar ABC transporter permease [Bradyrhizobium manausense]|jgi:multiple sugar transport system permease protein|uniref:carbohydrate ABC transporter permease n=1 Tax=Bradyrhizobium manausense TaxID=989370 RepID=UPI001BAA00AD|nr:sugar ABC transporter permease [Bradyrhizobium manausense]MBR0787788.1 sugar ABC transporter permease [Bradyrhizobium manausense]
MRERLFIVTMLLPAMVLLVLFYGYPIFDNLRISFTDLSLLGMKKGGNWVGLANYRELFHRGDFGHILFNTFVWLTATSVLLRLLMGLGIAVLLNTRAMKKLRLASVARFALLIPWATPPIVAVVIWRFLLERNGVVNETLMRLNIISQPIAFLADMRAVWPSIVAIMLWNTVPLIALSLLSSLQTVPEEYYEAAELDGATNWQVFRFVTLPFLMPAILVLGLMSVFWSFNNFVYVWLATGAGPGTFTNVLATEVYLKGFVDFRLGYSSAIGMMMAIIMGAFGILYLRLVARQQLEETL